MLRKGVEQHRSTLIGLRESGIGQKISAHDFIDFRYKSWIILVNIVKKCCGASIAVFSIMASITTKRGVPTSHRITQLIRSIFGQSLSNPTLAFIGGSFEAIARS